MPARSTSVAITLSGLGYLLVNESDLLILKWILKPGTILLIIWYAASFTNDNRLYRNLIITGLAASAAGDCFLLMAGNTWFLWGLGSFMVAHLLYLSAFVLRQKFALYHGLYLIVLAVYGYWLIERLYEGIRLNHNEQIWVPIVVYVLVISTMLWTAIVSRNKLAVIGALCFVFSDSLLAWSMFIEPVSWSGYGVMVSYYLAQFFIAASIREDRKGHNS